MYATIISAGIALFIASAAHGMNNLQRTQQQQNKSHKQYATIIVQAVCNNLVANTVQPVGQELELNRAAAEKSGYIKNFLAFGGYKIVNDKPVVDLEVDPETLVSLVEYLTAIAEYQTAPTHAQSEHPEKVDVEIASVLQEKIKDFDVEELSGTVLCADYLHIPPLQLAAIYEMAERLKNASMSAENDLKAIQTFLDASYPRVARSIAQRIIELNPHYFPEWKELCRLPHNGGIHSVVFNAAEDRVATGSDDFSARIWHAETGKLICRLYHKNWVTSVAFNAAGNRLVTASDDGTAVIWDAQTGARLFTLKHRGFVRSAAFDTSGERVATGSFDRTARIWNADTGVQLLEFQDPNVITCVAFNTSGDRLAMCSGEGWVIIQNAHTGQELHRLVHYNTRKVRWFKAAEEECIESISEGGLVKTWKADTGEVFSTERDANAFDRNLFNAAKDRMITCSRDCATIWYEVDLAQKNKRAKLVLQPEEVVAMLQQLHEATDETVEPTLVCGLLKLVRERSAQQEQQASSKV